MMTVLNSKSVNG